MGLQSQLNDVSSDSIPLLLVAIIAKCVDYLRSFLLSAFHSFGVFQFSPSRTTVEEGLLGSGLAGLILLADQLKLNRAFSYRYCSSGGGSDCVVCLSTLKDGDKVRKLDCRHVFHKECFDGWLDHLKFDCPLCRRPLVSDKRVDTTRMSVGQDLAEWFSFR
ncbi:E3 ubiquitin-protein ligase RHA2A-like [Euphorbia lathyris]|uniref:E3 ubiquitin-protein ligase RHA2A-like n=1 Tax=Euphorbia lathyris TaxID=212925 RepID=UPI0033144539